MFGEATMGKVYWERTAILAAWMALGMSGSAQANLIVNPGFEDPVPGLPPPPAPSGVLALSVIPGWTAITDGTGGGIEIQYRAVVGPPHSGDNLVELDSTENSGMFQDIAVNPGQTYE